MDYLLLEIIKHFPVTSYFGSGISLLTMVSKACRFTSFSVFLIGLHKLLKSFDVRLGSIVIVS